MWQAHGHERPNSDMIQIKNNIVGKSLPALLQVYEVYACYAMGGVSHGYYLNCRCNKYIHFHIVASIIC